MANSGQLWRAYLALELPAALAEALCWLHHVPASLSTQAVFFSSQQELSWEHYPVNFLMFTFVETAFQGTQSKPLSIHMSCRSSCQCAQFTSAFWSFSHSKKKAIGEPKLFNSAGNQCEPHHTKQPFNSLMCMKKSNSMKQLWEIIRTMKSKRKRQIRFTCSFSKYIIQRMENYFAY